jgi:hypothetical protein
LAAVIEDAKTGDVYDAPVGLAPKVRLDRTISSLSSSLRQMKLMFEDFIGKKK